MKIQTNSKKPRFWKEKSVEDVVVTLGPMAPATPLDSEMFKRWTYFFFTWEERVLGEQAPKLAPKKPKKKKKEK